jgi:diadenosine tetraphosphate (Ap4A) HIT family hydrolase
MSTLQSVWKSFLNRNRWMPREKWDALVRGDRCPLCADVELQENRYSFLVARLTTANLRLSKNQYARGYCVLVHREHATEFDQLSPEKQAAFMRDLVRAGNAIASVFKPIKMNYQLLGNAIPHLHWHIVPRYYGDPAPGRPLNPTGRVRRLKSDEYQRIITDLQAIL